MVKRLKVALVAGEASGDILGAGLMSALRTQHPEIEFVGVGGPLMEKQGLQSFFSMERLAVMGLVEVLGRLPELLKRRRELADYLLAEQPDVFVGIDAPDFNLDLALRLRQQGMRTVQYVSPSVWAWRQKRVFKIKQACDLVLCLLPFEPDFYREHGVAAQFVGHPLADSIALYNEASSARQKLGLPMTGPVVALLPGSRGSEVARLGRLFLQTAAQLQARNPDMHFVLPAANGARRQQLEQELKDFPDLSLSLLDGQSATALQACDAVLIASGTATLEAMLFKRPMVVAYRLSPLTYSILSRMVKSRFFALPNLLADEALVPEFIQQAATAEQLAKAVEQQLANPQRQTARFLELHQQMRRDASREAARAVLELAGQNA